MWLWLADGILSILPNKPLQVALNFDNGGNVMVGLFYGGTGSKKKSLIPHPKAPGGPGRAPTFPAAHELYLL